MTDKVHGYVQNTEAATGDWDIVNIWTVAPIAVTGVVQNLTLFKAAHGITANISTLSAAKRTFEGTDLVNDAGYNDAFAQQSNLDSIWNAIGDAAAPVMIGDILSDATATSPTVMALVDYAGVALVAAGDFGTDVVDGNALVYSVSIAIEHTDAYGAAEAAINAALDGAFAWSDTASIAVLEDVAGAAPSAGGSVSGGHVSATGSDASTKQSIVVVVKGNLQPMGGLPTA